MKKPPWPGQKRKMRCHQAEYNVAHFYIIDFMYKQYATNMGEDNEKKMMW